MSSGQGGSDQEPTGQLGQQGPPKPPAYPSAPPAYPSAPGYAAAPAGAWGDTPPKPLERPLAVRIAVGAFMAALILGLISAVVTFSDLDSLVDQARAQIRAQGGDSAQLTASALRLIFLISGVVALIFAGLEAMFIAFAWNGRNWARIVLWVLGGLGIVFGLPGLLSGATPSSGFISSLAVIQLLLEVVGVISFGLRPANEWYRYRRWLRATGQGR